MLLRVEKSAINPTTAAAIARMVSTAPTAGRAETGACEGRGAAGAERGAAGAAAVARGALGGGTGAAALWAAVGVGPPGGSVGSLMVGAAEGLGGRLIRTVSFLGWTFPVSFFGGTAPLGMFGMFSAINYTLLQNKVAAPGCQTLNPTEKPAAGRAPELCPLLSYRGDSPGRGANRSNGFSP